MTCKKKWRAMDHCNRNQEEERVVDQEADQINVNEQKSYEWIIIEDSEAVNVTTTDTQGALSIQLALQAAIAAIISLTIGDTDTGNKVTQEIKQLLKTKQRNCQKTIIQGSHNVEVVTTDTDLAINIQALLQILVAIVLKLDVL
jgi:spore coat protein X